MSPSHRFANRALFCALALGLVAASCERKSKQEAELFYLVTARSTLELSVEYAPGSGAEGTVCAGASSWLLRLNTTDGGPTWDYTFLFDGTRTKLYGCEGADAVNAVTGECANRELGFNLDSPKRVMIEGLSVLPENYETSDAGVNVVCRGIADDAVVDADIDTIDLGAPPSEPVPEPTSTVTTRHLVAIRMLRIGESNVLPFGSGLTPPDTRYGAAAGFSNAASGVGMNPATQGAGRIVLAGGQAGTTPNAEVWEFDPLSLSFLQTTDLGLARSGLTATAFTDAQGLGIFFAGGASGPGAGVSTAAVDVYRANQTIESIVSGAGSLAGARAFHTATYIPRATGGPLIALVAGGPYDPSVDSFGGGGEVGTVEYFLPSGSSAGTCTAQPSSSRVCTPAHSAGAVRMRHGAPSYVSTSDSSTLAWIAGGQAGAGRGGIATGQTLTTVGAPSFGVAPGLAANAVSPVTAVLTSSGNAVLDGRPLYIGGYGAGGSVVAAQNQATFGKEDLTNAVLASTLGAPRGAATGTTLRDRTVLIAGGRDTSVDGVLPLERLVPTTSAVETDVATFEPVPTLTGAAQLREARFGHTATRLDATRTWLDGAVLIAGGGDGTTTPELFVPAFECGGTGLDPVAANAGAILEPLSNPSLPPLCDRNRDGEPVSNPKVE